MTQLGWIPVSFAAVALGTCLAMAQVGSEHSGNFVAPMAAGESILLAQGRPAPGGGRDQDELNEFEQFLVGVWRGSVRQGPITHEVTTRFNSDKTYRTSQVTRPTNIAVEVWGKWRAGELTDTEGSLSTEPEDWRPREYCYVQNVCEPYFYPARADTFEKVNDDTVSMGGSTFRRIQRR